MNRIALIVLSFFLSTNLLAQVSGARVYTFLNLPQSAREAALGGASMAQRDGGLQTALSNPALLDARADGSFGLLFSPFIAGMNYGNVTYGKRRKHLVPLRHHCNFSATENLPKQMKRVFNLGNSALEIMPFHS